ncbi:DNA-(apurinic or apyrimidinic site) lyase 2 [Gracilariopsis chorda]|uniref:DNA-(apurinic or apyrimidinic site) endonuclease n=1 Tax=Gracilariopsis chorda TaxID=448386 RepID=A0A2V3IPC3_9FLOR|nr:DNA-(apurinic or apyrimidinic site) lyase 2 [Gracilariopsis chorda]|eukprot:PXF42980.1 DNA-(apurinic or apyrimidinic site) lyase 2 [Gracilariopsis chorda]
MRITSWNVNGLKSVRPLRPLFATLDSDIICLQETKISGPGDPELESMAFVEGYDSFFSICKQKRGYSGVATFCRKKIATPHDAGEGFCNSVGGASIQVSETNSQCFDQASDAEDEAKLRLFSANTLRLVKEEGRSVITDHKRFVLINVYIPAVTVADRAEFKMKFLHALRAKVAALHSIGRKVIIVGDFNICPSLKDRAEPVPPSELVAWEQSPTRTWLRALLNTQNMVDTFREVHPSAKHSYTCWSEATRSRENNHGSRIDLIVTSRDLFLSDVTEAAIWSHVKGSDHCPVSIQLENSHNSGICGKGVPRFCMRYMPRFAFRQQSLKSLYVRTDTNSSQRHLRYSPSKTIKVNETQEGNTSVQSLSKDKPGLRKRKPQYAQTSLLALTKLSESNLGVCDGSRISSSLQPPTTLGKHASQSSANHVVEPTGVRGLHPSRPERESNAETAKRRKLTSEAWSRILTGPPPVPRCRHGRFCVIKKVSKTGENKGRTFFSCPYPAGLGKTANCNFFQWAPYKAGFEPT